jgi:hypothetical protein
MTESPGERRSMNSSWSLAWFWAGRSRLCWLPIAAAQFGDGAEIDSWSILKNILAAAYLSVFITGSGGNYSLMWSRMCFCMIVRMVDCSTAMRRWPPLWKLTSLAPGIVEAANWAL